MNSYRVEVVEIVTHLYRVDGRSPEEAESTAEQYLEDGEEGEIIGSDIDSSEAVLDEGEEN